MYIVDYESAVHVTFVLNYFNLIANSDVFVLVWKILTRNSTNVKEIGLSIFGNNLDEGGQISVVGLNIEQVTYIFDLKEIATENLDGFTGLLGMYLSNLEIIKIFQNCRFVSDIIFKKLRLKIVNIFDLDVRFSSL